MIASIRGLLIDNNGDTCVIDVGGVGYRVFVSSDTAASLFNQMNQEVTLFTYTSVREDALDLFGFITKDERIFFEQIIAISGIGPKSGLGIVSVAPLPQLKSAIASGDTSYLTKVSGVGKKSAQKIVLELQDSLAKELEIAGIESSGHQEDSEVVEALIALGYTQSEARQALKKVADDVIGMQARLTSAIKSLG